MDIQGYPLARIFLKKEKIIIICKIQLVELNINKVLLVTKCTQGHFAFPAVKRR